MKHLLCIIFFISLLIGCKSGRKTNIDKNGKEITEQQLETLVPDTLPWSIRMAESTMKRHPESWRMQRNTKPVWTYNLGVALIGFESLWKATGEKKYFEYIKDYADTCIREDGSVVNYSIEEYNIDRVSNGKFVMDIYEETGEEKYKKAFMMFREQMRTHPRTEEKGFWHKKKYPWQMWLDGLYMGSPFLAEYGARYNEPELFDEVAHQILLMEKVSRDEKTGLLYHGYDEKRQQSWADPITGKSKSFWGRAMGWYAMAIIDALDYMPENHPKRNEIIAVFKRLTNALVKYQSDSTGLWYQVVDQGNREGNYFESSVSCMLTYTIFKGVRKGYIDNKYMANGKKAFQGIMDHFIKIDPDGILHVTNCNYGSGLSDDRNGTYEYYIHEIVGNDDPKVIGAFIMASLEMEMIEQ